MEKGCPCLRTDRKYQSIENLRWSSSSHKLRKPQPRAAIRPAPTWSAGSSVFKLQLAAVAEGSCPLVSFLTVRECDCLAAGLGQLAASLIGLPKPIWLPFRTLDLVA